ncbi:MAG: nucleotide exchange factor GrpE [Candidatus Eisenbacteria bacterium]
MPSPAPSGCWDRCGWTTPSRSPWSSASARASPTCCRPERTHTRKDRVAHERRRPRLRRERRDPRHARGRRHGAASRTDPRGSRDAQPRSRRRCEHRRRREHRGCGDAPSTGAGGPGPRQLQDRWLRTEADLQNVRRRSAREREEAVARAEESVLLDVIGLLDDLDRAIAALAAEQAAEAWAQGVSLTAQRMRDMLARHGVTPIAAVGQPFDPLVHEALLEIPAPEGIAPGCVAQEVAKGWQRGGRALRASRVVVARAETEA